jgi:predicted small lipoprotein YifL
MIQSNHVGSRKGRKMRVFVAFGVLMVLLVALSACAPLEAPPQAVESDAVGSMPAPGGTYFTEVPADNRPEIPDEFGVLAGKWEMQLNEDGSFHLYQEGILRSEGVFTVVDDQIEFTDLSGGSTQSDGMGIYQWTVHDDQLRFQAIADPVGPRRFTLTCMGWKHM